LDIILDTTKQKTLKSAINRTENKNIKISKKIVKKSTSKSAKKTSDLKSIFSKVKTSARKITKQEVLNIRKSLNTSRYKSKFEKQKKSGNATVSKLIDNKKIKISTAVPTQSTKDKDPYYSKIYEILSSKWHPVLIIDEMYAKVLVTIYSNGEFDYKFLQYSGNIAFDDSLKKFLEGEKLNKYPTHNKGVKTDIEVIFRAKG
jgi:hypothetical protein